MKRHFEEFCLNTYAHGFKYLTLNNISLLERRTWSIIITLFLAVSFYCSFLTWFEAFEKQTVTVPDTPNYPISNFFFPAVTICNFNVISKSRALKTSKNLSKNKTQNFSPKEIETKLHLLKYLTDVHYSPLHQNDLNKLHVVLENNKIEASSLLKYLSPTCTEMMQRCTWKGQHMDCGVLFKSIVTPYGVCCSFNYFGFKENVKNFTKDITAIETLKRVSATGYLTSLETVVNTLSEDYFATIVPSIGHKIIVHFPYDFPDRNSQMLLQYIQGLILVSVNPSLYRTDVNVNSLDINLRKCAFMGEKQLDYFAYTYHNCMSECRAHLIKDFCGCVPFYYLQFYENLSKYTYVIYIIFRKFYCYSVGVKLNNQSVVRVFFDDLVSTRYTTSLQHYWHTILGRIGGVLGLLIGFSTTSLIEILYFFVIRPIIDILFQYRIIFLYVKGSYK
ncbi:hypothetical protein RN001_007495 [Aquatica leii]|uniref:Sodium channel protein Nach n=1 Tax=Aquatica leii TaxID=1421715 RepID=A0AAN7PWE4_9COLE|nr:hypothetical protein RN001_007495 [Aquatica leii]